MKIFIAHEITDNPWGGANQFLRNLREEFISLGFYTESVGEADVILFNSHHHPSRIIDLHRQYPEAKFIHRIDGPMSLYNQSNDERDKVVHILNESIASATIFQSKWSQDKNYKMGLSSNNPGAVITNAADPKLFTPNINKKESKKIRIISTSFSDNIKKGFLTYKFIDDNLDFSKFDYVFLGRSPFNFNNIQNLGPKTTEEVAKELKKSHVYITASENDPCSNSLIEALSCKLDCFALKSGGHPEILNNVNDLLFQYEHELLDKLKEYSHYCGDLNSAIPSIQEIAKKYLDFFSLI